MLTLFVLFTEASYTIPVRVAPFSSFTRSGRWYSVPGIISTESLVSSWKLVGRVASGESSLKMKLAICCIMLFGSVALWR